MVIYLVGHIGTLKKNSYNQNCVFVCGDSQMLWGLDVAFLEENIEKQVLTSAQNGGGIYDFLVSEKSIPHHSVCVLSFSEAALLRNPLSDKNRTGLELSCLWDLLISGCPMDECIRIIELNKKTIKYKAFRTGHNLFPFADSLVYPELLSTFHQLFEEKRDWFYWKANAYTEEIQHLSDKHSQIVLVRFPLDKQVESFACNSDNRHLSDSLKHVIIENYAMKYDTITLSSDSLLMHDLSHMNEVGARLLTAEVASILQSDTVNNHFIEVTIR